MTKRTMNYTETRTRDTTKQSTGHIHVMDYSNCKNKVYIELDLGLNDSFTITPKNLNIAPISPGPKAV